MSPAEYILRKQLVASGLSSSAWDYVQAGLKTRAFWSSKIEDVRHLQTAQALTADLLSHARNADGAITTRAQVVSDLMRSARERGLDTGTAALSNPASAARAKTIADTNAALASGYVRHAADGTRGARLAYPAQELTRIEARRQPRGEAYWRARWEAAGGTLRKGRMVALKDAPECSAVSRFGVPYGPPDYGSGMGWRNVSFEDALDLGLVAPDYIPPEKPLEDFNRTLEADLDFKGTDDPAFRFLASAFGDQIAYRKGKVMWQGDLIRDAYARWLADPAAKAATRLGEATPALARLAPEIASRRLAIAADKAAHIYRAHVGPAETDPRNIPLAETDPSLIPFVWREPDRAQRQQTGSWFIERDTADGHALRLVVRPAADGLHLDTFYKPAQKSGAGA